MSSRTTGGKPKKPAKKAGAKRGAKKAAPKKKRKANPALLKPVSFDAKLAAVVGTTKPLPRGQILKKVWEHIKAEGHAKKNKPLKREGHIIYADALLKDLCGGKSKVHMMKDLPRCVNAHIKK